MRTDHCASRSRSVGDRARQRRVVEQGAFPLRVRTRAGIRQLARDSDILVDQILAWDNDPFRKDLGPLPSRIQARITTCIGAKLTETTRAGPDEREPSPSSMSAGPLVLTGQAVAPGRFVNRTAMLDGEA